MSELKKTLDTAKNEAVRLVPNKPRYAAMLAHLSACLRILDEIEIGDK